MSCISVAVHFGYGDHLEDVLQNGNVTRALLFQWIWATFSALMTAIAKFSVVAFLLSIQGRTHKFSKVVMYLLVGVGVSENDQTSEQLPAERCLQCMFNVATIFLIWFQCQPSNVLWDPAIEGTCPGNRASFYVGTISGGIWPTSLPNTSKLHQLTSLTAWGALADFYLAVFPVALVYSLKITKKLKALLCFLMDLGAFTAVCSAVKTYELRRVRSLKDPSCECSSVGSIGPPILIHMAFRRHSPIGSLGHVSPALVKQHCHAFANADFRTAAPSRGSC